MYKLSLYMCALRDIPSPLLHQRYGFMLQANTLSAWTKRANDLKSSFTLSLGKASITEEAPTSERFTPTAMPTLSPLLMLSAHCGILQTQMTPS